MIHLIFAQKYEINITLDWYLIFFHRQSFIIQLFKIAKSVSLPDTKCPKMDTFEKSKKYNMQYIKYIKVWHDICRKISKKIITNNKI